MNEVELELPGIDIKDARRRLVDDVPFLLSLLREFVRHSITLERSLVLDGTPTSLDDDMRKLHQLRGGAGNLGAKTVEGLAARLTLNLKAHSTETKARDVPDPTLVSLRGKLQAELHVIRDALQKVSVGLPETEPQEPEPQTQDNKHQEKQYVGRVLIIDDSSAMRSYLRATLEKHDEPLEIIEAQDGLRGFRILTEERPDLVLCDLQMPNFDGQKLLQMRANHPELAEIPVLMLTAEHESEKKVELLERGASDYITKPFNGRELLARVKLHLGVRRLREEVRRLRELLEQGNTVDEHTGLHNRRAFEKLLLDEVQRTTRYGAPLSLIVLELDRKAAAPGRGDAKTRDRAISNMSLLLSDAVRTTDKIARIAHDKFAIILPHTGKKGAFEMANRLSHSFRDPSLGRRELLEPCSACFGISSSEGTHVTAKEIMNRADEALAEAARSFGSKVVEWTPTLQGALHSAEA